MVLEFTLRIYHYELHHYEVGSLAYPGHNFSRLGSNSVVIVEFYYIKVPGMCNNMDET